MQRAPPSRPSLGLPAAHRRACCTAQFTSHRGDHIHCRDQDSFHNIITSDHSSLLEINPKSNKSKLFYRSTHRRPDSDSIHSTVAQFNLTDSSLQKGVTTLIPSRLSSRDRIETSSLNGAHHASLAHSRIPVFGTTEDKIVENKIVVIAMTKSLLK